jgi:hypothetical protein
MLERKELVYQVIDSDPILYQSDTFLMGDFQRPAEISCKAQIAYIDESLATHNILVESATQSRDCRKVLRFAKSGSELGLYLVDKYNLSPVLRQRYEEHWCKNSLLLAFYEKNVAMASEVRRRKKAFTLADWLLYWGSQNTLLNYTIRILNYPRRLVINAFDRWTV